MDFDSQLSEVFLEQVRKDTLQSLKLTDQIHLSNDNHLNNDLNTVLMLFEIMLYWISHKI